MVRGLFSEYSEPFRSQICTQKGRKVDRMDALQIFLIAQEEANELKICLVYVQFLVSG